MQHRRVTLQHRNAKWTCSLDMPRLDMQHGHLIFEMGMGMDGLGHRHGHGHGHGHGHVHGNGHGHGQGHGHGHGHENFQEIFVVVAMVGFEYT